MRVRAIRDHIEPKVHAYRAAGDEFEFTGKLYEHIEKVGKSEAPAKNEDEPADEGETGPDEGK
jgi:hypothetical protein